MAGITGDLGPKGVCQIRPHTVRTGIIQSLEWHMNGAGCGVAHEHSLSKGWILPLFDQGE